jgi:hypothetical protein
MATSTKQTIALRIAAVCAGLGAIYALSTNRLSTAGTLILVIFLVIVVRSMVKAKTVANPFGGEAREFPIRPVVSNVLKSVGCFVAAFVWAATGAVAVRRQVLPDTYLADIGLVVGPAVLLILGGGVFIIRAARRAMYGSSK